MINSTYCTNMMITITTPCNIKQRYVDSATTTISNSYHLDMSKRKFFCLPTDELVFCVVAGSAEINTSNKVMISRQYALITQFNHVHHVVLIA